MVAAQLLLAAICVGIGVSAPWILPVLSPICVAAFGDTASVSNVFYIPIGMIAAALVMLALLAYLLFLRASKVREFTTWDCGFGSSSPRTQVSAESYSQPIAWIFSSLLRYKLSIKIRGQDRRHFPEYISIEPRMVSLLERSVYRPALYALEGASKAIAKLQAGSIHLYLFYVCFTLIVLLFVGINL